KRQMTTFRMGCRPRGRVNLDKGYLSAGGLQLIQPLDVGFDFRLLRLGAVEGGEETLNNHRTLTRQPKDVGDDLFNCASSFVDAIHVILCACVELGPNLVA